MKKGNAGFTLVEIMIVVLIIGLLAAIAIPSFVRARDRARANACVNNLRQIEYAKEIWSMENPGIETVPDSAFDDLRGGFPLCPAGSTYNAGAVGEMPTCDSGLDGHELEWGGGDAGAGEGG